MILQPNVNNETRYHHFEPELSFILADLDCKKKNAYLLIACQLEGCHHKFVGWEQEHRKYVWSRVIKGRLKSATGNKTRHDYQLQR